jgi:hypothetical protein
VDGPWVAASLIPVVLIVVEDFLMVALGSNFS